MNALTRSASIALPRVTNTVQRRSASSVGSGSFSQNWLSDPSTYPIMIILGTAVAACTGFMAQKIMYCPDVRISKGLKGEVIRTWSK